MTTRQKIIDHAEACGWKPGPHFTLPVISFWHPTKHRFMIAIFFTVTGAVQEVKTDDAGSINWPVNYMDKNKLNKVKALLSELR